MEQRPVRRAAHFDPVVELRRQRLRQHEAEAAIAEAGGFEICPATVRQRLAGYPFIVESISLLIGCWLDC